MDSSPEALRKRLSHGNIYPPDQARAALSGRVPDGPGWPTLRELGLRLVADTLLRSRPL